MDLVMEKVVRLVNNGVIEITWAGRIFRRFTMRGGVKSFCRRREIGCTDKDGYRAISVFVDGKSRRIRAHRLVWCASNGAIPAGMQINHKNGIKYDNRVKNLEVVTPQQNILHAHYVIKTCNQKGENHNGTSLTWKIVERIRLRRNVDKKKLRVVAEEFGISEANVSLIARFKTWKPEDSCVI